MTRPGTSAPLGLCQWLRRSVAWVLAGAAGFAPIGYATARASTPGKGPELLFLVGLMCTQVVLWRKAVAGFGGAYGCTPPASVGLRAVALLWLAMLVMLLLQAALFSGVGWLLLGDDGQNWHV